MNEAIETADRCVRDIPVEGLFRQRVPTLLLRRILQLQLQQAGYSHAAAWKLALDWWCSRRQATWH
jgi:hypothetical protein